MTRPTRHAVQGWLSELRKRGRSNREIAAADIYWGFEAAREATEERRYGQSLEVIEGMAEVYPSDRWLQGIADEANALFVSAEECVSRAEALARRGDFEYAHAAYYSEQ